MTFHQKKQIEIINKIEEQIKHNSLNFSTVSAVSDYEKDSRICLTSVHLPDENLLLKILDSIINPLRDKFPNHYYYPKTSLHMTIKNVRVINNPPHFNNDDIEKAKEVFSEIIPKHFQFKVFFYRLLLFPNNLALVGTSDPELDSIILNLDKKLKEKGVSDDKKYSNDKYFFSNMTLARFISPITGEFKRQVKVISEAISFDPYIVDSVTLLTANAVLLKRNIIETWNLKS